MKSKQSNKIHQGHKARKRFGQNFLIDTALINAIAESAEPQDTDHIVEIGPGLGAITGELVSSGAQITLIELDRDLVARLRIDYHRQLSDGRVEIINEDVLKVDLDAVHQKAADKPTKLIGNLPYNISTPVLFHILNHKQHFLSMTFMLQKEVVDRLSAEPSTSAYSALSVIIQHECYVEKLFDVPPESFRPPPKVDSAVVQMKPKAELAMPESDLPAFRDFVHKCFQQRRKTLRNNLKGMLEVEAIESLGINPQDRPEHLHLDDYLALFKLFQDKAA